MLTIMERSLAQWASAKRVSSADLVDLDEVKARVEDVDLMDAGHGVFTGIRKVDVGLPEPVDDGADVLDRKSLVPADRRIVFETVALGKRRIWFHDVDAAVFCAKQGQ